MMVFRCVFIFLCSVYVVTVRSADLYEGDACTYRDGRPGACLTISSCAIAVADLRKGLAPRICSYNNRLPVVCCPGVRPNGVSQTTQRTTTRAPQKLDANGCPPLPVNATTLVKTGRKAIDKCIDYLEYVYPCEIGNALLLNAPKVRDPAGKCGFSAASLIIGGQETVPNEFPHMAAVGFGDDEQEITWQCGGSLVSEQYVLTAGHCVYSAELGDASFVLLGAHRKTVVDPKRMYRVAEIIKHPDYKSPKKYNDIALLKLDRRVQFDQFVRPACLPTEKTIRAVDNKYIATGWGAVTFGDRVGSDVLMKVRLEPFTYEDCARTNTANRQLREGIIDDQQMCIGHHTQSKDTCQGDSGGPLQVVKPDIYCMFDVVGVTSFGKACGTPGVPGVYTRVYYYTPWIESTIWP